MNDATKFKLAAGIAAASIGLGVLLVVVEFLHGPAGATGATPTIFGLPSYSLPWAERAFLFLFGAIHVLVAAIITVYRRTAV